MKIHVLGEQSLVTSAFIELTPHNMVELFVNLGSRFVQAHYCGSCAAFDKEVEGRPVDHQAIQLEVEVEPQPGVTDSLLAWAVVEPESVQDHALLKRVEVMTHIEKDQAHFLFLPLEAGASPEVLSRWPNT